MNYAVIISTFVATVFVSLLLPYRWNTIKRLLVAYCLFASYNVIFMYMLWLLNLKFNNVFAILIYFLSIILIGIYTLSSRRKHINKYLTWSVIDTVVVLTVLILTMLFIKPTFSFKQGFSGLALPTGGDMAHHFFIVNNIKTEQRVIYFDKNVQGRLVNGLEKYQQGPHLNVVMMVHKSTDSVQMLKVFQIYYLLIYLVFFALFLNISLDLVKCFKTRFLEYALIGTIGIVLFAVAIFARTYLGGFISHFYCLMLLLALGVCIISKDEFKPKPLWLISLVLLNSAIAASWYVLLPVSTICIFLALYRSEYKKNVLGYLAVVLVTIPSWLPSTITGSVTKLAADGDVFVIPFEYIVLFSITTILVLIWMKKDDSKTINFWVEFMIINLIFCVIVGLATILKGNTISYYFIKTTHSVILIALLFLGYFFVKSIRIIENYFKPQYKLYGLLTIFIIVSVFFGTMLNRLDKDGLYLGVYDRNNYFSVQQVQRIIELLNKYGDNQIVVLNSGSNISDYVLSKWVAALNLKFSNQFYSVISSNIIKPDLSDKIDIAREFETSNSHENLILVDFRSGNTINY